MFDNGLFALTAIVRASAYESNKPDTTDDRDERDGEDHV